MYKNNTCRDFALKYDQTLSIKARIEDLNLSHPEHRTIYNLARVEFLGMFEGIRYQTYYEGTGKSVSSYSHRPANSGYIAVGIGFNMEVDNAKSRWLSIFPDEKFYYDVLYGRQVLTRNQVSYLLEQSLLQREKELATIYRDYWHMFPANIRLAIEDLYYNIPSLVRAGSDFCKYITDYMNTKQQEDFIDACVSLLEHQHKIFHPQLHQRRQFECLLMGMRSDYLFDQHSI